MDDASAPAPRWREHLATREVADARDTAGTLFKRAFGHDIPDYPRHFILEYSPPEGGEKRVVAYVHHTPWRGIYLGGGMCVDERAYREMPRWLFAEVRAEGGLATIVTREAITMLTDSPAVFGHVGEPRARQADLRTGFVDTGVEHLMVYWRVPLDAAERARIIALAASHGPF